MSEAIPVTPPFLAHSRQARWLSRLGRQVVLAGLGRLRGGEITLTDAASSIVLGSASAEDDLRARITVHDPRAYGRVAFGGTLGAAESFARGEWSSDDLTALVRLFARYRDVSMSIETRLAWRTLAHRFLHALRRNTRAGSRRNIARHYDLGNDFFAAFLDPTMSYSCAVFASPDDTLEQASRAKIDLVCRKLALRPGDELLEIGSGWGELALHAARAYGCRVVTTTISRAQFDHVRRLVIDAGLTDRIVVLDRDYRELPAVTGRQFDKLVSIEMIEAVGEAYLPAFISLCSRLLKPTGRMLLQAIVIADQLFDAYRRSVDFIQRYIFPGGFLPSRALLHDLVGRSTDLRIAHVEELGDHYARTLAHWHARLHASREALRARGYSDRLLRLWQYYFAYCEGGFLERTIGLQQLLLAKPLAAVTMVPSCARGGAARC